MVVVSLLPRAEFGRSDQRDYTAYFITVEARFAWFEIETLNRLNQKLQLFDWLNL